MIKDGYSWSRTNNVHTDGLYTSYGYDKVYLTQSDEVETLHTSNTKYQEKVFKNASNGYYTNYSPTKAHASTQQWIWLNKNDVLTLHMQFRSTMSLQMIVITSTMEIVQRYIFRLMQ